MIEPRALRYTQYIDRPFPAVRGLLRKSPRDLFQRATVSAAERAEAVAASLHASAVGVDVRVAVDVHIGRVYDEPGVAGLSPETRITLAWEASHGASFFPVMNAELSLWALTAYETQIEMVGAYRPPLGVVGDAVDAALGHRIAEAAVHRFLDDIIAQIRLELRPEP